MAERQESFFAEAEKQILSPRLQREAWEREFLSPYAQLSAKSKGRQREEKECSIRTVYQRDCGRIIYSLPFRRLRHKTQVFFNPQNDHVCTRMEHVIYVSYLAEVIGSALHLNTDLIRAISMGHDIGHAPFGHAGERVINKLIRQYGGDFVFQHELHSLRVVDLLADHRGEAGLNLSFEVRDGIVRHCGERYDEYILKPQRNNSSVLEETEVGQSMPATLEACVVRLADRIAYVGRDIEDAQRSNLMSFAELPRTLRTTLGNSNSEIVNTLVQDVIESSYGRDLICLSSEKAEALQELIEINITKIYNSNKVKRFSREVENIIAGLFDHFLNLPTTMPRDHFDENSQKFFEFYSQHPDFYASPLRKVVDYIAGMTDPYARRVFSSIYHI